MKPNSHSKPDRSAIRGAGANGFGREYWNDNYDEPETMDGIYNARLRAIALKALFDSEYIEVASMIDFGFGLGELFREIIQQFMPITVVGLEPSMHAFSRMKQQQLTDVVTTSLLLQEKDILSWSQQPDHLAPYDLGICTSVFQYLSDSEIERALPVMAERVHHLYFSVPTDRELRFQAAELNLDDHYAILRTQQEYKEMLRPHFTIVSNRILESNVHYDETNTPFTDFSFGCNLTSYVVEATTQVGAVSRYESCRHHFSTSKESVVKVPSDRHHIFPIWID